LVHARGGRCGGREQTLAHSLARSTPAPFLFLSLSPLFLTALESVFLFKNYCGECFRIVAKNEKKTECELYKGFFREISQLGEFYFQEMGREEKPTKSM
jgi:hypothetical protein